MGSSDSKIDDPPNKNNVTNPDKASEVSKCAKCQCYLSCGPIQIQDNGHSTCGRCQKHKGTANIELEAVLKVLSFPCRFKSKGCSTTVKFNQALQHEEICRYRTYNCPSLSPGCKWEGSACDMHNHFKNNHKSQCLQNPVLKLDINQDSIQNFIFNKSDDIIMIQYQHVSSGNSLSIAVSYFPFNTHKEIFCTFKLCSDKDDDLNVNLKKYACQPYQHAHDVPNMRKINMKNYLKVLDDPDIITVKISFQEGNSEEEL